MTLDGLARARREHADLSLATQLVDYRPRGEWQVSGDVWTREVTWLDAGGPKDETAGVRFKPGTAEYAEEWSR